MSEFDEETDWARGIQERIQLVASNRGNSSRLAQATGIPVSSLYAYIKDGQTLSAMRAAKIAQAGQVSLDWLVYGREQVKTVSPLVAREQAATYGAGELCYVRMYSAIAGAKAGGVFNEGADVIDTRAFRADWVRNRLRARAEDLAMLIAYGDSMNPLISDGDSMLVDLRVKQPLNDDIYVIRSGNSLQVKRVQRTFNGGLRIISENPAYPSELMSPEDLTTSDWECVGRVVWWAHTNA